MRLIVPGWVGIANIKWLGQIQIASAAVLLLDTINYVLSGPDDPTSMPLTHQNVKSAFELATSRPGQLHAPGPRHRPDRPDTATNGAIQPRRYLFWATVDHPVAVSA